MSGREVVLMMGPPGAGKGTQALRLSALRDLKRISTGDILRSNVNAGSELGLQAKHVMDVGELVSDDLIVAMVNKELSGTVPLRVLLDGFPRTPSQADALSTFLDENDADIDAVLSLEVEDDELLRRLLQRASAEGRSDDSEDIISERMRIYRRDTEPLMGYYREAGKLHRVDGTGGVDEVLARIGAVLS
jgi:adenylate kinase